MANLYPAVRLSYERSCREEKQKNLKEITIAFIGSMLIVLFVPTWTLKFQMWGALLVLYFAMIL
ncbi:hypothetical protein HOC35_03515 [Candidatus Woesearchaeota archaeon]|jgi:hypothetical protein|nr:hypothetical protein [Candidatus Woesearchaeota archaeon]